MNTQVAIWTQAARPKTLVASLCPVLLGSLLAMERSIFDPILFLYTLLAVLSVQIGTNLANDYFDFVKGADTSARKGPLRVTQAGLVSPKQIKIATTIVFAITGILGLLLAERGGISFVVLTLIAILCGIFYTAGSYSIAYLGLGELFAFAFFGPIATYATDYLQNLFFNPMSLMLGVAPGCFACTLLVINNIRDIDEDRIAGKHTLAVRFGAQFGKWEYCALLMIAFFSCLAFVPEHPFCAMTLLAFVKIIPVVRGLFKNPDAAEYNRYLEKTAQLYLTYSVIFFITYFL